jgi:hypothetical protein
VLSSSLWAADARKLESLMVLEGLRTPESVLVYKTEKETLLFVSEIEGEGAVVDGKGGIAKLNAAGEIIDIDWVRGLNAPKGLAYFGDSLFVADITEVVEISIAKGEVLRKIPVADSVFLNDVTINMRGEVFVSDTRTNKVHRIIDGKVETYLENITSANGLKALGSNLIVAANDTLWLADEKKKLHKLAEGFAAQADGVEMTAPGEFIVSCWAGLIYYIHSDGRLELLLDSREQKINTADIGYDSDRHLLYVPNFFNDTMTTYRLH